MGLVNLGYKRMVDPADVVLDAMQRCNTVS